MSNETLNKIEPPKGHINEFSEKDLQVGNRFMAYASIGDEVYEKPAILEVTRKEKSPLYYSGLGVTFEAITSDECFLKAFNKHTYISRDEYVKLVQIERVYVGNYDFIKLQRGTSNLFSKLFIYPMRKDSRT